MYAEASFSECGKYRWWLSREVSLNKKTLLFIGLNPSKASTKENDPTLRRLEGFCRKWSYGRILVVNLFGRISKSPTLLKHCVDPVGNLNDDVLSSWVCEWAIRSDWDLWFGWGEGGSLFNRNIEVLNLLQPFFKRRHSLRERSFGPLVVGLTRHGNPRHPLYISGSEVLKPFLPSLMVNLPK